MAILIREVWNDNLEEEFALIREIIDDYNYVAVAVDLDTEFPAVHRPLTPIIEFNDIVDYNYHRLKDSVDLQRLLRLGLTFSDEDGNLPNCGTDRPCVWQFNFIDQPQPQPPRVGVDINRFQELLMSSSVVLNEQMNWVTFHGGDHFGHLLRLLTSQILPEKRGGFFSLIKIYFPSLYDIKYVMKFFGFDGDLDKLVGLLEVDKVDVGNQAGWHSLLIARTFTIVSKPLVINSPEKYAGVLFGLGPLPTD